jgi:hypothetical protein
MVTYSGWSTALPGRRRGLCVGHTGLGGLPGLQHLGGQSTAVAGPVTILLGPRTDRFHRNVITTLSATAFARGVGSRKLPEQMRAALVGLGPATDTRSPPVTPRSRASSTRQGVGPLRTSPSARSTRAAHRVHDSASASSRSRSCWSAMVGASSASEQSCRSNHRSLSISCAAAPRSVSSATAREGTVA